MALYKASAVILQLNGHMKITCLFVYCSLYCRMSQKNTYREAKVVVLEEPGTAGLPILTQWGQGF